VGALTEPVFGGAAEWVEVGPQWPFSFRLRNRSCLFSGQHHVWTDTGCEFRRSQASIRRHDRRHGTARVRRAGSRRWPDKPVHRIEAAQKKHANWKGSLGSWVRIVEGVEPPWNNFPAVRRTHKDADPVGDCVVFDINNNEARLISYIDYEMGTVTVLAVLTHKQYDKGRWKSACNC
jgi:mRNA interferase HigB